MRRDIRGRRNQQDDLLNEKIIKYTGIGFAIIAVIVAGLLIYSKNLNDKVKDESLSSDQIASILSNTSSQNVESSEETSSQMGKNVNEASNELNVVENEIANNTTLTSSNTMTTNRVISGSNESETTNAKVTNTQEEDNSQTEGQLEFIMPVEGDIVRDFAVDSLVFSETLQEWVRHTGIDIKADKTTVVKASEAGTVKTIKNDPRYGLTITIEHSNGFQTVYSNLLSSEFVVEGEKVEKGQSVGTVGNTAAFEIADDAHLHFEILKDSVPLNPTDLIK